jgi:SAM-dependent methyltransferase
MTVLLPVWSGNKTLQVKTVFRQGVNPLPAFVYCTSILNSGKAISEAYRVLKPDGIIIVSISCGYIDKGKYIFGIVDSDSNFVDVNMPFRHIEIIREKLTTLHISQIIIRTTKSEIFISGRKGI